MKVTQTVVQIVLDQLIGTRYELSHGFGWALALLSRWRPAETAASGGPALGEAPVQAVEEKRPETDRPAVLSLAPDVELLRDLRRVHTITDSCSMYFYRALGRFEPEVFVTRFGSWLDACEEAGLIGKAGLRPSDAPGPEDLQDRMISCLRCHGQFRSRGRPIRLCRSCRERLRT